jgi:adenylylsulfate kinase
MRVLWITGLPGSGKTTLARHISSRMKIQSIPHLLIDGDDLREILQHKFGYEKDERIFLGRTYVNFAKKIAQQGIGAIVSTVSMHKEVHQYLYQQIPTVQVIYIKPTKQVLDERNQKNLRQSGVANSPGISLDIDEPYKTFKILSGLESISELDTLAEELAKFLNE